MHMGHRLRRVGVQLALNAAHRVAFPFSQQGLHPGLVISELITWPAFTPVQRFSSILSDTAAWLGATVGRYSFCAGLFHPQLHTGLPRRFLTVPLPP